MFEIWVHTELWVNKTSEDKAIDLAAHEEFENAKFWNFEIDSSEFWN